MRQNGMIVQNTFHQNFQLTATGFLAEHTRRNHPGIIEDQQITGLQQVQDIAKLPLPGFTRVTIQHQQAAGTALRHRITGNEFIRQVKLKIGYKHGRNLLKKRG